MKKKIFYATGSMLLLAAGVFAGRMHKATPAHLYYTSSGGSICSALVPSNTSPITPLTTAVTSAPVYLQTAVSHQLFATKNGSTGACQNPLFGI